MTKELYGRCRMLKPWPQWDNAVHDVPDQVLRQGDALRYPFSFAIHPEDESGDFSSADYPDVYCYHTTLASCTCAWQQAHHTPCKHMYRLAVELGIIEIVKRGSPRGHDAKSLEEIRASGDVDAQPEQIKRIEGAKKIKPDKIELHVDTQSAIFSGSGKVPYITSLDACTCRDYALRKLPCKHIYRLRMELDAAQAKGGNP